MTGLGVQFLHHQGDDVRLGDRLAQPDGHGAIVVGLVSPGGGEEPLARRPGEDVEQVGAVDSAPAEISLDHFPSGCFEILFLQRHVIEYYMAATPWKPASCR